MTKTSTGSSSDRHDVVYTIFRSLAWFKDRNIVYNVCLRISIEFFGNGHISLVKNIFIKFRTLDQMIAEQSKIINHWFSLLRRVRGHWHRQTAYGRRCVLIFYYQLTDFFFLLFFLSSATHCWSYLSLSSAAWPTNPCQLFWNRFFFLLNFVAIHSDFMHIFLIIIKYI